MSNTEVALDAQAYWDVKSILMALGIAASLMWNLYNTFEGNRRRKSDRAWNRFKEEIYDPLRSATQNLKRELSIFKCEQTLLSANNDEAGKFFGDLHVHLSEIEKLCIEADKFEEENSSSFSTGFAEVQAALDRSISRYFSDSASKTENCGAIKNDIIRFIDKIFDLCSNKRKEMELR